MTAYTPPARGDTDAASRSYISHDGIEFRWTAGHCVVVLPEPLGYPARSDMVLRFSGETGGHATFTDPATRRTARVPSEVWREMLQPRTISVVIAGSASDEAPGDAGPDDAGPDTTVVLQLNLAASDSACAVFGRAAARGVWAPATNCVVSLSGRRWRALGSPGKITVDVRPVPLAEDHAKMWAAIDNDNQGA